MGLTKEEKKAKKLAKSLEKAKLAAETRKTQKRDELQRELAAQEQNRMELSIKLHALMATAKESVFKENILVMMKTFDRTIDKKNHVINFLMKYRRIADHQYHNTIASFCVTVDGIVSTFLADLEAMCENTNAKINTLLQQGQEDTNYIKEFQKNAETHLSILLFHSHKIADNLLWTMRGENFVKQDEDTNKYLEIGDHMSAILEGLIGVMWGGFKQTLKKYIIGSAENQKEVRKLRKKDALMSDIIASQAKKIIASDSIVRRLQIELIGYESGTKQSEFRERRQRHKDACFRLKQYFAESVEIDKSQLYRLVMTSNETIKHLENASQRGEKILRMAALCRKFETLKEKVIPFGLINSVNINQFSSAKTLCRKSDDSLVANAVSTSCGLARLLQRISKAELSKRSLYREKMLLEQENANMLHMLRLRRVETSKDRLKTHVTKCTCNYKTTKKIIKQLSAVEGCLETRKIMNY